MKKSDLYIYISLSLALLVPVPGRLAYGIIMIFLLYFLVACGILLKRLVSGFFNDELNNVILSVALISLCIFFRQIVIIYSPLTALVLGILLYMPAFTPFVLGSLYSSSEKTVAEELKGSVMKCSFFCIFALLFFLLRDIFGYGTISLPAVNGIFEIRILRTVNTFIASIPGAIVLLFLFIVMSYTIIKRFEIVETSEVL